MNVRTTTLEKGWSLVGVGLRKQEIEDLIDLLQGLRDSSIGHFHLHADFDHESPSLIGDIEVSLAGEDEPDNMRLG